MSLKAGVDIVYIPRMVRLLENQDALQRMLHPSELADSNGKANGRAEHIAGIIAAKEAFFKAFEQRPRWHDVEVKLKTNGKPTLSFMSLWAERIEDIDVSISHDQDYAIACVVIRTKNDKIKGL